MAGAEGGLVKVAQRERWKAQPSDPRQSLHNNFGLVAQHLRLRKYQAGKAQLMQWPWPGSLWKLVNQDGKTLLTHTWVSASRCYLI